MRRRWCQGALGELSIQQPLKDVAVKTGDRVAVGDALATLEKSSDPDVLERCAAELLKAFAISSTAPERDGLILERV